MSSPFFRFITLYLIFFFFSNVIPSQETSCFPKKNYNWSLYMISKSICFGVVFKSILVSITAWRKPLLCFLKINLWGMICIRGSKLYFFSCPAGMEVWVQNVVTKFMFFRSFVNVLKNQRTYGELKVFKYPGFSSVSSWANMPLSFKAT